MHSKNTILRLSREEGRQAQIMSATVLTLAEIGYANTSLAQIAQRTGISTSLILYHFKDKDELMAKVLDDVTSKWILHVQKSVQNALSSSEKLRAYITSSIGYMVERPEHMAARIEIIFNARSSKGTLTFETESYSVLLSILEAILTEGKRNGEFKEFDMDSMATVIRAAIDQYLGLMGRKNLDGGVAYIENTCALFVKALTS